MNEKKSIKKYFSFLKREGFRVKFYQRDSETEAYFYKDSLTIECFLYHETLEIVFNKDGKRENLLKCTLFETTIIEDLKKLLSKSKNIEMTFDIYSKFLNDNKSVYIG